MTTATAIVTDGAASIAEAAKFLGVSQRTVSRLMDSGQIGFTRGGKVRKIPRRELIDYLARGFVPARE